MTFMDSMLQAWLFVDDTRSLFVPTEIQNLTINIRQHIVSLQSLDVNAEQGRFQMCFVYMWQRIYLTSLASVLLLYDMVSLGICVVPDVVECSAFMTWVTTCPVIQFHISDNESSALPL